MAACMARLDTEEAVYRLETGSFGGVFYLTRQPHGERKVVVIAFERGFATWLARELPAAFRAVFGQN